MLVDDRAGHQMEFLAADRDVGFMISGQRIQNLALMGGVLVEHVHAGADQLAGVERRQNLAQLGFGLVHHALQGVVRVHDVVVAVGDHNIRPDHVERRAHPQIDHFLGDRLLEHLRRFGDGADFVAARGERHVNDAVVREFGQNAGNLADRPGNDAPEYPPNRSQHDQYCRDRAAHHGNNALP